MENSQLMAWLLLLIAIVANLGLVILIMGLSIIFSKAEKLKSIDSLAVSEANASLTVIIPTYNEEKNIYRCLSKLFASKKPSNFWKVILVDDSSSDRTVELSLKAAKNSTTNFEYLKAGQRPSKERWVGKNWPCSKAMEKVKTEWVLFLDADVSLEKDTLSRAMNHAISEDIDLLSLAPKLTCSCLAEWMVQPIMASLLSMGFPIHNTNNPNNSTAFAAGPFMLFRRSSYEIIGGHKAVAGEVIEDLALAKKIKSSGFKLRFLIGLDALELNMYSNFASLWEGWSKNWFLGLEKNILKALLASLIVFWMFSIPWILLPSASVLMLLRAGELGIFIGILALSITGILLQFTLRVWTKKEFDFPIKNWWLMGVGGVIILFLGPTSIWRTITGIGWTWKGRSLA